MVEDKTERREGEQLGLMDGEQGDGVAEEAGQY